MIMKLKKSEARAQRGCRASGKKFYYKMQTSGVVFRENI
jgi:hypothetical protein